MQGENVIAILFKHIKNVLTLLGFKPVIYLNALSYTICLQCLLDAYVAPLP